jgi:hypothetical protein
MNLNYELQNAVFILQSSLNNLRITIDSFGSPVHALSDGIIQNLSPEQIQSLELSFQTRANYLRNHLIKVSAQLALTSNIDSVLKLQKSIQHLTDHYYLSEKVYDCYLDFLHTRSEQGMGIILKGCDKIAKSSLQRGLKHLDKEIPPVITYLDFGQGAALLAAGVYLWDYQTNPAALIKVVRSAIPFPRLTSILHECGHQAAKITGWNEELEPLIYDTVSSSGYPKELASLWALWTSEIAADFWSLSQSNFASVIGLSEVLSGSANRIFDIIPGDPHPMGYLRVMLGIEACNTVFGNGPWLDYRKVWQSLFPLNLCRAKSYKIIMESIPILTLLCKCILTTKMACFSNQSLQEILPWDYSSPKTIKSFLNNDLSTLSVPIDVIIQHPVITLSCFRYMQMFGGRSQESLAKEMRNWLVSLGTSGN